MTQQNQSSMSDRQLNFIKDQRGISTQIAYVLTVAIAALLVSVFISSTVGVVDDQQDNAVQFELESAGERLGSQVQQADTAGGNSDSDRIEISANPPDRVAGVTYSITLERQGTPETAVLKMETTSNIEVDTQIRIDADDVEENTVSSTSEFDIVYEDGTIKIEE